MGFKMKGPSITKGTAGHKKAVKDYKELQVNRNMEQNMPDGRSMSSPFQKNGKDGETGAELYKKNVLAKGKGKKSIESKKGKGMGEKEISRKESIKLMQKGGKMSKKAREHFDRERINTKDGESPAKKTTAPASKKSRKQKVAEMYDEHKGKPGFQEHVDKVFGGKTTFEGGVSTTRKPKASPAKTPDGPESKHPNQTTAEVEALKKESKKMAMTRTSHKFKPEGKTKPDIDHGKSVQPKDSPAEGEKKKVTRKDVREARKSMRDRKKQTKRQRKIDKYNSKYSDKKTKGILD